MNDKQLEEQLKEVLQSAKLTLSMPDVDFNFIYNKLNDFIDNEEFEDIISKGNHSFKNQLKIINTFILLAIESYHAALGGNIRK